jgi:hypothetical protein
VRCVVTGLQAPGGSRVYMNTKPPPNSWQLEVIDDMINIVPMECVDWLNNNGNLEYYLRTNERAQYLIRRLNNSIKQH